MEGRWIKLYEAIQDHKIWSDEWLVKLFIWCLLRANSRPREFQGKTIPRGSFVTGRHSASDSLQVSPSKFYRGIQKLAEFGSITIEANSVWTTLTICNYETYQSRKEKSEQPVNSEWTASEQRVNTTLEGLDSLEGKKDRLLDNSLSSADADGLCDSSQAVSKKSTYSVAFETWWKAYPRRAAKHQASAAYGRAISRISASRSIPNPEAQAWLLARTRTFATSRAGKDSKFTPHPTTWLNAGRWDDDDAEWGIGSQSANLDPTGNQALLQRRLETLRDESEVLDGEIV